MVKTMRRARALISAIGLALVAAGQPVSAAPAKPEAPGENLKPFAVHIFRAQRQSWPGYGVYLGEGLVVTAAHVPGHARDGDPSVEIAGETLPAKFVREGEFETVDLTLLRVDPRALPPSLGLRLMPVCDQPIRIGQAVVVVTPEIRGHFAHPAAKTASGRCAAKVFDGDRRCGDDRQFRIGRVRSGEKMPDGRDEPEDSGDDAGTGRAGRKGAARRSGEIFRAGAADQGVFGWRLIDTQRIYSTTIFATCRLEA